MGYSTFSTGFHSKNKRVDKVEFDFVDLLTECSLTYSLVQYSEIEQGLLVISSGKITCLNCSKPIEILFLYIYNLINY